MKIAIVVSTPEVTIQPLGLWGDFEENVGKIAELGYDAIELFVGDPGQLALQDAKDLIRGQGLEISAIGTGLSYTQYGLSFTSPDVLTRKRAVERIERYVELAAELRSNVIIGSMKGMYQTTYEDAWNRLEECLKRCTEVANDLGVYLLLEPLNRYESNIINTFSEAVRLIEEIGSESIRVMGDTFHMNIEEENICKTMRDAEQYLAYLHVADSNRQAPGRGHIDFEAIMTTLREIGYDKFVSAEILPIPDQDVAAKSAIEYLKGLI